ncbi:uncharacterized protein LOC142550683 [Primulina tabacum]|uniref:uncharacterized protein LOC142550683 n=1 Tax=Primulina tabacum TaxID=48773 RepID=UPI003F5904F0
MDKEKTVEEGEFEDEKEEKNQKPNAEVEVEQPPVFQPTLPYPQSKALCDLGASINLMPFSIYRDLELGEVKPTTITLQLAEISLTYPRGIVEDVLVKVDKFIFPADFVILDMEEDQDAPLIFGRPFLTTGRALIDVHKGELTLRVGGEAVIFNIYHAMKGSNEVSTCKSIDIIDSCMSLECAGTRDPLESCLISAAGTVDEDNWEVKEQLLALEASQKERKTDAPLEELEVNEQTKVIPPSPDLKELPSHLCYAFLGEKSTYLRRLNPAMKEVVKNEVLKLLNAGVIYAISDSSWVSPVQVVPKKGGINVAFEKIKMALVTAPIMIVPDWKEPFELMCDASDYAVAICYLFAKKDAKPHLIRWILLLQEFDFEVKDKKDFMGSFPPSFGNSYILLVVDYVSKWVEAIATNTNDARVVVKFVHKNIFTSVKHKVALAYHPQAKGLAEVSNRAFWAVKKLNFDLQASGDVRKLQLSEMDEFRNDAYENAKIYKEQTKKWHDKIIVRRELKPGQQVLLFNSRLKLFPGKLKSRWSGPFVVEAVYPYGAIELKYSDRRTFKVNGQRVKPFYGTEIRNIDSLKLG